jgi:hypothetical protein
MIFSLFEIAIRMASIEVLHYRKDGEVEASRMTRCRPERRVVRCWVAGSSARSRQQIRDVL